MSTMPKHPSSPSSRGAMALLAQGQAVEVRQGFTEGWTAGFDVATSDDDGVEVRRRSDGRLLPKRFGAGEVRPA